MKHICIQFELQTEIWAKKSVFRSVAFFCCKCFGDVKFEDMKEKRMSKKDRRYLGNKICFLVWFIGKSKFWRTSVRTKWISTLISKWNFYLLKQSVGAERRKIFVKKFYWKQRQRNVVYLLHHLFSIRNFVNSFINQTY